MFCNQCGAPIGDDDRFCQNCGMPFDYAGNRDNNVNTPNEKRKKGKAAKIAALVAAVLLVIGVGGFFVLRLWSAGTEREKARDFLVYLKDNELTMARKNKYEPRVIGDRVFEHEDDASWFGALQSDYFGLAYSPNGKYLYYPQKSGNDGYSLYRREIGNRKAEPEKIDSQVVDYKVIDNERVAYLKGNSESKLYLYRKGEAEKIASKAYDLRVSEDGKHIMWRTDEQKLYVQDTALKADKVKLDSDITYICAVSDDFSRIVYQKEDSLYLMRDREEKDKIASNVHNVFVNDINNQLRIYYLKEAGGENIAYYDLVEDDCQAEDQTIEEPRVEDYQIKTYKNTFWGMQESVDVSDSYYEELEKYQRKQERDELRSRLQSDMLPMKEWDIYYYDEMAGKDDKVMTALMQSDAWNFGSMMSDAAFMYAVPVDREQIEKIKLSEVADTDSADYEEILQKIQAEVKKSGRFVYLENGIIHEVNGFENEGDYFAAWAKEKELCIYLACYKEESMRLYRLDYGKENASLELLTENYRGLDVVNGDQICYLTEENALYCGDTLIAEDVGAMTVWDEKYIFYLTDMDQEEREGTLHLYSDGKDERIADDVAAGFYCIYDSDKVAFLSDYNFKKYRGDLQVYDGKKTKQVDTDVTCIFY